MTHSFRNLILLALAAGAGGFAGTTLAQDRPRDYPPAMDRPGRFGGTNELTAQQFAQGAFWSGLKEIRLGELAQQRAENSSIRDFGRQMVQDHSAANTKLKGIAQRKGLTLPETNSFYGTNVDRIFVRDAEAKQGGAAEKQTEPTREKFDNPDTEPGKVREVREFARDPQVMKQKDLHAVQRLQQLSGRDFDRAYVTEMVADHSHAVRKFQMASTSLSDPDLKAFATETLPKLREHLRMAQQLARDNGWPTTDITPERELNRLDK